MKNKTVMAVLLLVWILSLHHPFQALASTGGWMGGSSFSSSPTSYSSGGGGGSSSSGYSSSSGSGYQGYSYTPQVTCHDKKAIDVAGDGKVESPPADDDVESKVEGRIGCVFLFLFGVLAVFLLFMFLAAWSDKRTVVSTSIVKLQVCISGNVRSVQRDLDRIAQVANTSTAQGFTYVLTETTKALLKHSYGCISCYSSVDVKRSTKDGARLFKRLSTEERSKVDEETLVNVNGVRRIITNTCTSQAYSNKYIVTTILVAVEGVYETPVISTDAELMEALQKLGSIPSNKTKAVEVFWTPQKENDTLTGQRLGQDYRLLNPLVGLKLFETE